MLISSSKVGMLSIVFFSFFILSGIPNIWVFYHWILSHRYWMLLSVFNFFLSSLSSCFLPFCLSEIFQETYFPAWRIFPWSHLVFVFCFVDRLNFSFLKILFVFFHSLSLCGILKFCFLYWFPCFHLLFLCFSET